MEAYFDTWVTRVSRGSEASTNSIKLVDERPIKQQTLTIIIIIIIIIIITLFKWNV